ncbi:MAG TPA: M64 family metallopeptidase [Longimicrobiales bacterium]|nr:M64 family metallopeptidase [Longimicrobiales bacterium]
MTILRSTVLAAAALAALAVPAVHAQQTAADARVVALQVTGDPAARFSLVVLGDGYTAAELPKFRAHVDKHLNVLWSIEPFRSYRSYINVYAVEIASPVSGITCDPAHRERRDTPLGLNYSDGCTNPNARGIVLDAAPARRYAALATPHFDQILVIANTDTYGGIGGSVATTSGGNSLGTLITPHELGHSLGRLQDEYTYSARGVRAGAYNGAEPNSAHHTLLTEAELRARQLKWWRWLGEPSESGGVIGRYEGGQQRSTGVWRPSKHSMMISLGYYFDQVSREQMVRRISAQVELIAASTRTDAPVGQHDVLWIETAQPVYHELDVTWALNGRALPNQANSRYLHLRDLALTPGEHTIRVTAVDRTPFVRDPAIRDSVLTATREWRVGDVSRRPAGEPLEARFTASTQTERPIGGTDVVYVETTKSYQMPPEVHWLLNGQRVGDDRAQRTFHLGRQSLPRGTHTLAAVIPAGSAPLNRTEQRLTWRVDNTLPTVAYTLSRSLALVLRPDTTRHYFVRDSFTMQLDPRDDQPGYVVAEFRVNGDGWHHYYGWPDAPEGTPFLFTPRGTTIKELVYGSLSAEGLSPQPWEPREPGWGTHRIEYRAIDAAGNIGAARAFHVTILPSPACTATISGTQNGDVRVASGVTCLNGATVTGSLTVLPGASIVATNARISGAITAQGAAAIELIGSTVDGSVRVAAATQDVTIFGTRIGGDLSLVDNRTPRPITLAGSRVAGAVACSGNSAAPQDYGARNELRTASDQCR